MKRKLLCACLLSSANFLYPMHNVVSNPDQVIDIELLQQQSKNKKKKIMQQDFVDGELNALERGIDPQEDDKKIITYLKTDLQKNISPELEALMLQELANMREHNNEQYSDWLRLPLLQESFHITRDKGKKLKKPKKSELMQLLKGQTELHKLYADLMQEDMAIKLKQVQALEKSTELTAKRVTWQQRSSLITGIGTIIAVVFSVYNFVISKI